MSGLRARPVATSRPKLRVVAVCTVGLALLAAPFAPSESAEPSRERPSAVAGQFYPGDPEKLRAAVSSLLEDARPPGAYRPISLIAPHAGYVYSGQIAADAFRQAMDHRVDLVILVGTNHTTAGFDGVSIFQGSGYRTPLGLAAIGQEVAAGLVAADRRFTFEPAVHWREHSVEVMVPFVQVAFPGVPIVTAVVGSPEQKLCVAFGRALAEVAKGRNTLLVASSDLSHYPVHADAVAVDLAVLRAIASLDTAALTRVIQREMRAGRKGLSTCACGEAPIRVVMEASRRLGATHGRIVSYANSGDTAAGNRQRVVGYGAVSFEAGEPPADPGPEWRPESPSGPHDIEPADGKALVDLARLTIERYLATETVPLARELPECLSQYRAAFVTLKTGGRLRGCMGGTTPDRPLWQAVESVALQAAFSDPRFPPLTARELPGVDVEVSVLSPMERVDHLRAVELGTDGILLRRGSKGGLLLPEVATEQGWDLDQLASAICRKAGLERASCFDGAELYTFQTQKFQ